MGKKRRNRNTGQKTHFELFSEKIIGKEAPLKQKARIVQKWPDEIDNRETPLKNLKEIWKRQARIIGRLADRRYTEHEMNTILKAAGIRPADRIASIASGIGIMEAYLAKNVVTEGKIVCIDLAHSISKKALEVKRKSGAKNLSVITGSATNIPLSTSSQNKILLMGSNLELTIHWKPFLKEARRVLKKNFRSRLVFAGLLRSRSEIPEIVDSLERNGFMLESIVRFAMFTKCPEAIMFVASPKLQ